MNTSVTLEKEGDIGVIVINNPPINAGSLAVRQGLLDAITSLTADSSLQSAVLIGAGSTFVAGSDLREFGKPIEAPDLPAVIAAIEACPKPVVAAIHGSALGGGLELALGCDARIAEAKSFLGLPEVTLGIIPGAGGTQRLPRLIGLTDAVRIGATGLRITGDEAQRIGLVDVIADGDLRQAAVLYAKTIRQKHRARDLKVRAWNERELDAAVASAVRTGKGRPAVLAAIAAIKRSTEVSVDQGLSEERETFQHLRVSREALALRHQFFAERESGKLPQLAGAEPLSIEVIAVLGAGTMGSGIVIAALDAGFKVVMLDQDAQALTRGVERIQGYYRSRVVSGKMKESVAAEREARLKATIEWSNISTADLVIEAVFESLEVKLAVFAKLAEVAKPGAILASNTSYLDLDAIAGAARRPGDVIGLHFFSPANVMRLVEVVRCNASSSRALATGMAVAKRLKKLPVFSENSFGFIGNRIYAAYRRQCEFMLEDGASPQEVDEALQRFGFAMGPFAVADLSGLDIAWRMRQANASTRDTSARYVHIPDRLCELGRLGRKTGAGYYRYADGKSAGTPDSITQEVIEHCRAAKGVVPRTLSSEEILRRAMLAIVNEAALLVAEGVAARPSDVDVVLVNGYGFPKWEGGPVFWAQQRGLADLEADVDWLAKHCGPGFVRGDVQVLLKVEER